MSNLTVVDTKIMDEVCFKQILDEMGFKYVESEGKKLKVSGYDHIQKEVDMLIDVGVKSYKIGVIKTPEGMKFVADWWGIRQKNSKMTEAKFMGEILPKYSRQKVINIAKKQGYIIESEKTSDTVTELKLTRC